MKKISFLIVALVVVALAVFVAVGLDSNQAGAFPTGFSGGCQACHAQGTVKWPHDVTAHANILGTCTNCHEGAPGEGTAVIAKCTVCHGSAATIAAKPTHATLTCKSCHAAATTTTTAAPTTTTTAGQTTTTTAGQTTTTNPPSTTSTTATGGSTTSTTAAPTTTTTVPAEEPSFTG